MLHKHLTVPCAHTSIFFISPHAKPYCPTCCPSLISYCYSGIHHCLLSVTSFITLLLSSSFHIYLNTSRALLYSRLRLVPSVIWSSLRWSLTASRGVFQLLLVLRRASWAQKRQEASAFMPSSEILSRVHFKTKQQTFQKFRFHSIFNFPRLFLQLYSCVAKSKSNSSLNLLGPPTHVCWKSCVGTLNTVFMSLGINILHF